jgi:hypothetical protein
MGYQNLLKLLPIVKEEVDNAIESLYNTSYDRYVVASKVRLQLAYYTLDRLQKSFERNCLEFGCDSNKIPYTSLELRLFLENFIHKAIEDFSQSKIDLSTSENTDCYSLQLVALSTKERN